MFETVAIPVWMLWGAGVLALAGLMDRILMPTVRWYLRRRFNRAIVRLNARLDLQIPQFKRTNKRILVDRLVHDPRVIEAVLHHMAEEDVPYELAHKRAERYAREIVPSFSAFAYFGFGIRFTRWLSKALYRVRLGHTHEAALDAIDKDATVVFVMNHRSNMDYILVTYLAARRASLSYAVGEWARVWPLSRLIRSMGAYFIRRKSRNTLYRRVLARYVQMATEGGVAQAVFPEGGLTRQGALLPAKLGLLSYIVAGFEPDGRDVVFVPVGLNYDRVLEDRVLLATASGERASFLQKVWGGTHFVTKHVVFRLLGRFRRFGYASVNFGEPLSLKGFANGRTGDALTEALGDEVMKRVGAAVPVLPVSLIASVLLDRQVERISRVELERAAREMLELLRQRGAYTHIPEGDPQAALEVGIHQLSLRRVLRPDGDDLVVAPHEAMLLRYYANAIAHLLH